jgi:hypothetical protein
MVGKPFHRHILCNFPIFTLSIVSTATAIGGDGIIPVAFPTIEDDISSNLSRSPRKREVCLARLRAALKRQTGPTPAKIL